MRNKDERQLYKVYRVGGRGFSVYLEEDKKTGESCPAYPDFEAQPEYTAEGRPFATSAQESCPFGKSKTSREPPPGDCGGCGWFYRESTPWDPIGVCMCENRRKKTKK